jgi:hypothetical protein
MKLMEDEQKITELLKGQLTLTTHRVRYESKIGGDSCLTSIMLEDLCWCDMIYRSNLVWLVLGIVVIVISIVVGMSYAYAMAGSLLGIVFLIAYFSGRGCIVALASAGGKMKFDIKGSSFQDIAHFIDRVETAKNQRYLARKNPI